MAKFITLHMGGKPFRYNADHIVQYWGDDHKGSRVVLSMMTEEGFSPDQVDETPEQIDALLGVTADPVRDDLIAALKLVRSIITEGATEGFNPRVGDWAQRLYESQGVTYRAIAAAGGAK